MDSNEMVEREFEVTAADVAAHKELTDSRLYVSRCGSCPAWQALAPLVINGLRIDVVGSYVQIDNVEYSTTRELADAIIEYDLSGKFPLGTYRQSLPAWAWKAAGV